MKSIVCEMCGSNDVIKTDRYYVCNHCGTKYTTEEAKKLIVEGSLKIDDSAEVANLYTLARRAVVAENYSSAQQYYEKLLIKNPNDWEANFYSLYCRAINCTIAQIENTTIQLAGALATNITLIQNIEDEEKRFNAACEMGDRLLSINKMLHGAAVSHYRGIDASIRTDYLKEYVDRCLNTIVLAYNLGDGIEMIFGERYAKRISLPAWKQGVEQHKALMPNLLKKDIQTREMMKRVHSIQKYEPSYAVPTKSEGCYVATCVYGSYDCPQVWVLRRFRDNLLMKSLLGRTFVKLYYACSPIIVKWFGKAKWFHSLWKPILDQIVSRLNEKGYVDTPCGEKQ